MRSAHTLTGLLVLGITVAAGHALGRTSEQAVPELPGRRHQHRAEHCQRISIPRRATVFRRSNGKS